MNTPKLVRFDWAMKNILRDKSNFDILEGFLSELLKQQITIDKLLESEGNQDLADEKFNRVDLLAHTTNNEKIIVEVQTANEWDFYHRILFGTSKVITEYISKGQPYSKVPKVISVSILHFNLGVGSDYIYKGITEFTGLHTQDTLKLDDRSTNLYINQLGKQIDTVAEIFPTYYLIQLPRFTGEVRDKFDQWVYLLSNETIESDFDAQGIIAASEKLDVLKLSDEERRVYNKYWDNVSFEASLAETQQVNLDFARHEGIQEGIQLGKQEGIQLGKQEGRQEGLQLGEQKAQLEIAKKMLASGMAQELVAEITNLSLEQIKTLH